MAIPTIDTNAALEVVGTVTGAPDPLVYLQVGGVVLARTMGFMMVAPFFGSQNVPAPVRVMFGVMLGFLITPYVADSVGVTLEQEMAGGGAFTYLLLLGNQVLIGLMLAFVVAFIFYAIESAGRIIDTQRGSNMNDIVDPSSGQRTSPTGQFLQMTALCVMVLSGLHMYVLEGFVDSFNVFPPQLGLEWIGDPINAAGDERFEGPIREFAALSGASLELTVKIAAPVMLSLLLTDTLLGVINRGAPQVNVFALSMTIKGSIGIGALMVALVPTMNYLVRDIIPSTFEGRHSVPAMAERMQAAADADAGIPAPPTESERDAEEATSSGSYGDSSARTGRTGSPADDGSPWDALVDAQPDRSIAEDAAAREEAEGSAEGGGADGFSTLASFTSTSTQPRQGAHAGGGEG